MRQTWENQVAISAPWFFFMGFEYLSGGKSLGFYGLHLFFLGGLHNQPTGYPAMMSARPWLPRPKRRKPGSTNVARLKLRRTSSRHLQLFALAHHGGLNGRIVSNSYIVVTENKFRSQPGCLQVFGTAFSWTSSLTLPIAQRRRCQITGAQWAPLWTTDLYGIFWFGYIWIKIGYGSKLEYHIFGWVIHGNTINIAFFNAQSRNLCFKPGLLFYGAI